MATNTRGSGKRTSVRKKKRSSGKGAAAAKSADSNLSTDLITQRLRRLEVHVAALQEATGFKVADDEQEAILFALDPGGPSMVRLTLDETEVILLGSDAKASKPRSNGVGVSVFMEVWGNPGQQASISVTNAGPSPMTSSVLTSGHTTDVRSLKTKF